MFCLAHQIGGQIHRIGRVVCYHQNFAGAGDHINIHLSVQKLFGGCHIDVSGAYDFVHLRNGLGSVSQRRHRLGAAGQKDPVHPGDCRGG